MAETTQQNRTGPSGATKESAELGKGRQFGEGRGASDPGARGKTTIADGVVEKIAGMAARDVDGVHAMGSGAARTFGAVRDRVPGGGKPVTRGVKVEVGEVQTAIDLDIVVEYGVSITEVAADVRESVINAIERMTGLEVVEVNIAVGDVKLPDEEDEEEQSSDRPRLQ
ncbi:Asp23/Gls24 family envelope stress response protein [Streptomyces sp. TRM 70361]|uniref:Asp23/Gls24 family envelope stress response protein n=1 Tax=Streptomyces sp. TRM 70361 TaxID=3116553 RepID=UPI002E7B1E04|nr:Asp23/Gls24 family envelope stress response protein [Streptomyces sp. TRM 70361]MEE1941534.1 Asp23/Gls24 family envelope stress response protein [Streptomyces sp. TRM 70361]